MNQIASSILILAASICGYTAAVRPTADGYGGLMSLVALGLGLWGALALLTSVTREASGLDDEVEVRPRLGQLSRFRGMGPAAARSSDTLDSREYRFSPETNAQISLAAQLNGQSRNDVVEEVLRANLPRYTHGRVA